MNIEYQDVITLDNKKKYIVASIANYKGLQYLYLINIINHEILVAVMEIDGSISIIEEKESDLLNSLYPLFYENSKDDLEFKRISAN